MKQLNILYRRSDSSYTWVFVERDMINKVHEKQIEKSKKRFTSIPLAKKDFEEKHPKINPKIIVRIEPEKLVTKIKASVKKVIKPKKK